MKLLIINTSPRTLRSNSRRLTGLFASYWLTIDSKAPVVYRDLGLAHVPHVTEQWIAGAFKAPELRTAEEVSALAKSDEYIKELREADVIAVGVPMYNYGIPSSLKAYLDQVIRINETWVLNRENIKDPYIGQLKDKKLILILSRGAQAYEQGGYNEHLDFQASYLRAAFKMMGIKDVQEVVVDGELNGGEELAKTFENAQNQIRLIVEMLGMSCELY
ncbi:NAD(P)H-dependent oxidoreductase [Mucilaginibacter sp. CAU 1740]|uniref:FMN-dependent NADH-azoreductase n=1 Tax=Mucilaginibacter sp. CAU 1740 TaxID=3140365 RepID=UPI00325B80EE